MCKVLIIVLAHKFMHRIPKKLKLKCFYSHLPMAAYNAAILKEVSVCLSILPFKYLMIQSN